MKRMTVFMAGAVLCAAAGAGVAPAVQDVRHALPLGEVRLEGAPGAKLDAFVTARMTSAFAQKEIFGEARSAFERRDDDSREVVPGRKVGGIWRGEFWGKLMIGTARVADYLRDPTLLAFVREESHRLMALADSDGYLGSYADKENVAVSPADYPAMRKAYGWNTSWNLWNRKYAMWGLFMAYKATGDRTILESVEKQMDQWIAMMHKLGLPLSRCGQPEKVGLPPMSVLKPLLLLYEETGKPVYLAYAREIVQEWNSEEDVCPNFLRHVNDTRPISTWYPKPNLWAKTYEMLSCLDGILEYYRVTGDRLALDAIVSIRENIVKTESNPLGGIGYCDQLYYAAKRMNGISEICDAVHWIRLNLDLHLITGEDRYLDAMELCYLNNFLAGVYRDGAWTAFAVRSQTRHEHDRQCGYAHNHCCVNNAARTWMDMASAVVTTDAAGTCRVNFFSDATVRHAGATFRITGNYPVGNVVTVKVTGKVPEVRFRKPAWCPKMTVGEASAPDGKVYTLTFDMDPRIVNRPLARDPDGDNLHSYVRTRYGAIAHPSKEVVENFRTEPAAEVMWGPLILAKSYYTGATTAELADPFTVNGKGYALKVTPVKAETVWGAWDLEFTKAGEPARRVRACDYSSAADAPYALGANTFSIWF